MEKKSYNINVKIYDSYLYKSLKDKKSKIIPFNTVKNDLGAIMWYNISYLCLQLSNFGYSLKLLVPNNVLKVVRGWINYLCKVISQKMIEKEMGYRASKLIALDIVKEQRVDGGCRTGLRRLRCTLMGFERNCRISLGILLLNSEAKPRIPCILGIISKQINIYRLYSSKVVQQSCRQKTLPSLLLRSRGVASLHNLNINPFFC